MSNYINIHQYFLQSDKDFLFISSDKNSHTRLLTAQTSKHLIIVPFSSDIPTITHNVLINIFEEDGIADIWDYLINEKQFHTRYQESYGED